MAIQAQFCLEENLGFSLNNHHQQDLDMENNACGGFNQFCFNPQQQKQSQHQYQSVQFDSHQSQFQKNQRIFSENLQKTPSFSPVNLQKNFDDVSSMDFGQSIFSQMEKERIEINRFITLQNEGLRLALQEQRKQQMALFLQKYEDKTRFLLKQRDEEISKASNKTIELENLLKRMEIESQTWQRLAKENESMVVSLNSTIQRLRENNACVSSNDVDDAHSCCDDNIVIEQEHERNNMGIFEQQHGSIAKMVCRGCSVRNSCVIMLPCRHLSCCKDCGAFLDSCPVCGVMKKASIEALF